MGVFPGIAIGKVRILKREPHVVDKYFITRPEKEIERVNIAFERAVSQLKSVKDRVVASKLSDHASIIDAHLMMLSDPKLRKEVSDLIRSRMINAEWAVDMVIENYKKRFAESDSFYLSEKSRDLDHLKQEILGALADYEEERDLEQVEKGSIIVAYDLTPADTLRLNLKKIKGFVTEGGGRTSHTAILARSLEIPAVIQVYGITEEVDSTSTVIVDGIRGLVIVDPEECMLSFYRDERKRLSVIEKTLVKNAQEPAKTRDGFRIRLYANLELLEEVPSAIRHGSEGVGLFRTEYLYFGSMELPTVSEQFKVYKHLAEEFGDRPVVIRTLDLGGEKNIPYLRLRKEANPALGLRAVRLCLKMKGIFYDQLEAILKAGAFGNLKILVPFVTRYEDMEETREIVEKIKGKLRAAGDNFDDSIEIGAMLEVPSSIFIIDKLSEITDFFSVGTNDLIQYTLAVDRGNDAVYHYFDPVHPAVLKLLSEAVQACNECGKPISICGEIGGNPLIVPLLVGIGYDKLSMNPLYIPIVKEVIKRIDRKDARALLDDVLSLKKSKEAWKVIVSFFSDVTKDIIELLKPFVPALPQLK